MIGSLRINLIAHGLTVRWRGIDTIMRKAVYGHPKPTRAEVRQVLDELVLDGTLEYDAASYADGAWRLRR